ncbi:hypothetical protein Y1Q_0018312 [Alligator mississippiensis]|nr:hypothetical protein Y1Q_0018312 [Alligator mississippiensis]
MAMIKLATPTSLRKCCKSVQHGPLHCWESDQIELLVASRGSNLIILKELRGSTLEKAAGLLTTLGPQRTNCISKEAVMQSRMLSGALIKIFR